MSPRFLVYQMRDLMIRCIVALVGERVKQLIWTEKILRVLISSHTSIGSGLLVIWMD
jgi:hypothetical protein